MNNDEYFNYLLGYGKGYEEGSSGGGGSNTALSVTGSQAGALWEINWQDLVIPDTITTCTGLFYNLKTMNAPKVKFNSNITNLEYMYNGSYTTSVDMTEWDITNVTSFNYTFAGSKITSYTEPLVPCTASNVNCNAIFYMMGAITKIEVPDLTIEHVGKIEYGFYSSQSLTSIDIRNFKATGTISAGYCFDNCKALEHLDIRGLEQLSGMSIMRNVPTTCEIIVKDATIKAWWNTNYPSYTNVKTVEEYEA